jgi:hypothetical protein
MGASISFAKSTRTSEAIRFRKCSTGLAGAVDLAVGPLQKARKAGRCGKTLAPLSFIQNDSYAILARPVRVPLARL